MAKEESEVEVEVEEEFEDSEDRIEESSPASRNNSLTKRRLIDNMLEERRLQRQISEFDFDF